MHFVLQMLGCALAGAAGGAGFALALQWYDAKEKAAAAKAACKTVAK